MDFDPLLLSRIQFGFTIAFHIVFPAITIGLASYLALLELLWLRTGEARFRDLYRFFSKLFAVCFGMGVVSGVVLSYQIGTNWSGLSQAAGNVMGPLLAYEVLSAFFLEAGFLGVMLFGWNRVGPRLHFLATCLVAAGTLMSAFWILSANSWMQTPAGYSLVGGEFRATDWLAAIFNPSFPYRLVHMVLAAYLSTGLLVGGIAAWHLLKGREETRTRTMLAMSVLFVAVVAPLQIVAGDQHGLNTLAHQPAKIAAMEANWDTRSGMPLILFALPDPETESNRFELAVPKLGSLILTHSVDGVVRGLKSWPEDERPPVTIVFWSFRIMVASGFAMLGLGLVGTILYFTRQLYDSRWFLWLALLASPLGLVAVLAGWVTTEVGRQPWVVYGQLRTADALAPLSGGSVAASLAGFVLVYCGVFGAGVWYLARIAAQGPAWSGAAESDIDAPAIRLPGE
ncbi:cytochrome bd-I ubiquinol oxidase subunit 1 apoprotein [Tistlia consotensis]|uniref:Cytochrome bd-I ubiquinol oxidase subunit 1 apoprotein n=1 Tax=Tistlia consotensis USBA 355 TaxID=560819 RepID=A0A1Y6BX81_9PROT|nr:cytochrome ubiquinol oxidase subunit I [Tistlia consotensis]SMF33559.1 cytochrome bd-I ubiquinol oxidase subunit 1 apoprotein [Tistlia consotensis USBA 355]SNR69824.1 cytochrome bd-I ubiquinol oxidase subunit 1 apoprotein [Tistlia consotensis]